MPEKKDNESVKELKPTGKSIMSIKVYGVGLNYIMYGEKHYFDVM